MGVRGLTSYIHSRERIFFDEIQLKDCTLIVDGNSLIACLYNSKLAQTSAFGGDYDRIADETEKFFKRLLFNNVYPIVVFDGAVEKRKFTTCKTRCARKVLSLQGVTPMKYNCNCFPLLMRVSMREKLMDMDIVVLQSDLEADSEIAALSKIYRAPVLSNDSDYFIFDVLYIPIPMMDCEGSVNSKVTCKIFRMDKFLQYLDLDRSRLPLLSVILGNDYIQKAQFAAFLGQIRLGKGDRSKTQKQISGLLRWIKRENVDSALQKILSCMRTRGRIFLKRKIIKIMKGYTNLSTELKNYIPNDPRIKPFNGLTPIQLDDEVANFNIDMDDSETDDELSAQNSSVVDQEMGCSASEPNSYCNSEARDSENDEGDSDIDWILSKGVKRFDVDEVGVASYPAWLLRRSRKGLVPPCVLTLLNLKTFFSTPQPENYELPYAGEPYTELLRYMGGLLLGETGIQYWHRQHRNKYEKDTIETITGSRSCAPFPPLENLDALPLEDRRAIFNDIMFVDDTDLKHVPEHLKLYIITVNYWLQKDTYSEIKPYHVHAVIMMMMTMLVIDENIGYHRQRKTFIKKYGQAVSKIAKSRDQFGRMGPISVVDDLIQALSSVKKDDCIFIFDSLLPYFHVDRQLKNSRHFSSSLVHSFARLQCCLQFVSMLNAVLCSPYQDMKMHKFYNSTFLYNIASNLKKRANIPAYAESFFLKAPSLLNVYKKLDETFRSFSPPLTRTARRKTRKKKKAIEIEQIVEPIQAHSGSDNFYDKNNKFCALLN